ncbi:alpha/beta fold hydrolase [Spongiimicrobium salis]|uniref:alpha/beta fold hydrolase n=1 Tax=Spongiimicrobium salis TaxID=1667022 RepID=UPI00374DF242
MKFKMKLRVATIIFALLATLSAIGQVQFQKTTSFYPDTDLFEQEDIVWGKISVPENWDDSKGNEIHLAVAVLKNTSGKSASDAIVYIPGGPGGDGISSILFWLNHPLRAQHDIVLLDIRGTGFSEPRLCPDLGKDFLEILAKDQSILEDEKQKVAAAITCKNSLLVQGIDVTQYNSTSVAKDLNSLKKELGYAKWHVYAVSYGTYMAQVYTSQYPDDILSLVLDSAIPDISNYYTKNTGNYIKSLYKVFEQCKNDPQCNSQYPDLEKIYYQTISMLQEKPITVAVDKEIVTSGSFTYNMEDFKIALQQGLYDKNLIEVIPLLIYEFHNRNKGVLASLVAAFSEALEMDYGVYFSVSCNEVLPFNNFSDYRQDASKYKELKGGISFYKSDFDVFMAWHKDAKDTLSIVQDLSNLKELDIPVLVFSGGFDPITPATNGEAMLDVFKKGYLIRAPNYGHVPGFSDTGVQMALEFIKNPEVKPNDNEFTMQSKAKFIGDIKLNPGVINVGRSLIEPNLLFLGPLIIALGIALVFFFVHLVNFFRKKYVSIPDKIVRILVVVTSFVGLASLISLIFAIVQNAQQNFYTIVFGLPKSYGYIFTGILIFMVLLALSTIYLTISFRKIKNRSIVFSILFSNILLAAYLFYWQMI